MWFSFTQENGEPLLLNDESGIMVYQHPRNETLSRIMVQSGSCRDVRIDFYSFAMLVNATTVPQPLPEEEQHHHG